MDLQSEQSIQLYGPNDTLLKEVYKVVDVVDKHIARVKDNEGRIFRVFKGRIARVLNENENISDNQVVETTKQEEKVMTSAESTVVDHPVDVDTTVKKPKAETKDKAKKTKKAPIPFNLKEWITENGGAHGIHLMKESTFDCDEIPMTSHILINPDQHVYLTLNVYKYPPTDENPDGVLSLGKSNSGGNKYPLKGKKMTTKHKGKDGREDSKTYVGKLSVEDLTQRKIKDGYKKVN
jgi:hypothetical protein